MSNANDMKGATTTAGTVLPCSSAKSFKKVRSSAALVVASATDTSCKVKQVEDKLQQEPSSKHNECQDSSTSTELSSIEGKSTCKSAPEPLKESKKNNMIVLPSMECLSDDLEEDDDDEMS